MCISSHLGPITTLTCGLGLEARNEPVPLYDRRTHRDDWQIAIDRFLTVAEKAWRRRNYIVQHDVLRQRYLLVYTIFISLVCLSSELHASKRRNQPLLIFERGLNRVSSQHQPNHQNARFELQ
jgi:hypothetical protein